jgi:hypothetical protein
MTERLPFVVEWVPFAPECLPRYMEWRAFLHE